MTGTDVTALRNGLGMTTAQFAQLIGVNPSTLYRWELKGPKPVLIEPFQLQLLTVLQQQLAARRSEAERRAFAEAILGGLLLGGGLLALFKLLESAFAVPRPPPAERAAKRSTATAYARKAHPRRRSS